MIDQIIAYTPQSLNVEKNAYVLDYHAKRFGTIGVEPRRYVMLDGWVNRVKMAAEALKGRRGLVINLSPLWWGSNKWSQAKKMPGCEKQLFCYFDWLMQRMDAIKEYMHLVKYVVCEGEWCNTRHTRPREKMSIVNNFIHQWLKELFPLSDVVVYGRGMCVWNPHATQIELTPWWRGFPHESTVDILTTHMYDPLQPRIEFKNLEATCALARTWGKSVIVFVSILYNNYRRKQLDPYRTYTTYLERLRAKELLKYTDVIIGVSYYPTPIISNEMTSDWHYHQSSLTGEMKQKGHMKNVYKD